MVYTSTENTQPMKITNTAEDNPIPNHKMENGIHEIGGIGLKILMIKELNLSKVSYHPRTIPNGIATTDARMIPENTFTKVLEVCMNSFPLLNKVQAAVNTFNGLGKM